MAIINVNGISGINSITAQSSSLNFYTAAGNNLPITAATLNVGTGASVSSPATNVLTLGTNNTEAVRINSSGFVGVGTNNPAYPLQISKTLSGADPDRLVYINQPTNNTAASILLTGRTSGGADAHTLLSSGEDTTFNVYVPGQYQTTGTKAITINSSGNTGIGTTNPLTKVHIQGTGNGSTGSTGLSDSSAASALLLKPTIGSGTALALGTRATGGHYIQGLYAASSVVSVRDVQINPYGGSVGIGTFADAFGGVPGNSTFVVGTTGVERLRIDSSGNLGIGTNNPLVKTHIVGSSSGGGKLYIDTKGTFAGTDTATLGFSVFDDGTTRQNSQAEIRCVGDANYSGNLVFYLQNSGTYPNSLSERFRMTTDGILQVTQSPGKYALDTTLSSTSIANGGTVDFATASGLLIINNWSNGNLAVLICAAGGTVTISQQGTAWGTVSYNPGVGAYRFTNNTGSTQTFAFMFLRTRPNA